MIENELRDELTRVELEILKYMRRIESSKDETKKREAEDKLSFYTGKEEGLLEAIKIL